MPSENSTNEISDNDFSFIHLLILAIKSHY